MVETVPPYGTSSYCPRCGKKGRKVRSPLSYIENKKGRHFWCPYWQYRDDRDYIGALNIYRVFRLPKKQRYFIKQAKPIIYKKMEASLRVTVLAEPLWPVSIDYPLPMQWSVTVLGNVQHCLKWKIRSSVTFQIKLWWISAFWTIWDNTYLPNFPFFVYFDDIS